MALIGKISGGEGFSVQPERRRGRAAASNVSGRFEREKRRAFDDEWDKVEAVDIAPLKTEVFEDASKRIITYNQSPDIPFDRSINPYRGCEHGCIYCFARPTHAYLGLSSGLDFETKIFFKPQAACLLEQELRNSSYRPQVISIGSNTDPYQPIERKKLIMRKILEVLDAFSHPVSIITKSALVTRDIDILTRMSKRSLVHVSISITSLDHRLSRKMEPRASSPQKRLHAMRELARARIPTGVMVAPIIPALNDQEIENILNFSAQAGASSADYIFIRLPHEVKNLFREWLQEHYPERSKRIMRHIQTMRGGRDNNSNFHERFNAEGFYAEIIRSRFKKTCRRLDLNQHLHRLNLDSFSCPNKDNHQLKLF